jgi:hypothetical protein
LTLPIIKPPVDGRPSFRVLSFRWGREPGRTTKGWTRLLDHSFGSRAAAEGFARLRVESGAITGAAVFLERQIRAEGGDEATPLALYGRTPENLEA